MQRKAITLKLKPCKWCKEPTTNKIGLRYICSIDHAVLFGKSEAERKQTKQKAEARKNERKANMAAKESIKPLSKLCAEARKVVQRYCRLRDQKWGVCISCSAPKIEHGCHYFAVGSKYRSSRLSLDPRQIHGGCIKCNKFVGGGNRPGYDAGLLQRYGPDYLALLQELKRKADSGEDAPLTKDEVATIKKEYAAKCRELKKNNDVV